MDVSTASLVQAVAAARVALSEAFVLKVGQSLQAIVMGKGSDGLTELKIGDQVVTAKLAQTLAPGTTLQLQVKANGTTPQLAIVEPDTAGDGTRADGGTSRCANSGAGGECATGGGAARRRCAESGVGSTGCADCLAN